MYGTLVIMVEEPLNWDVICKALIKDCIQDFIDYFAPGAKFVKFVEGQLQTSVNGPFQPREIRADLVPGVELDGQHYLHHYELQSTKNQKIAPRLLDYIRD